MFESDRRPDLLSPTVVAELRREPHVKRSGGRAAALAAIMDAVREAPAPTRATPAARRRLALRPAPPRWALRRGVFSAAGGALAASLALSATWLGTIGHAARARAANVIADSAARAVPAMARLVGAGVLRDSLVDRALVLAIRDTLRVVHFAFEAPATARVALVGDFTQWDTNAVALHRSGNAWRADVKVGAGRHRYGFVVDDTQWVAMAERSRAVADTI